MVIEIPHGSMTNIGRLCKKLPTSYNRLFFRVLQSLAVNAFAQQKTPRERRFLFGGERGIRTLETVSRLHTFQACAFSHSAISPYLVVIAAHSVARGTM
jgi:hypothetical protein